MLIQSAIDTLDMGEMDAFTLQETVQVLSESAASFGNPFTLYLHLGGNFHRNLGAVFLGWVMGEEIWGCILGDFFLGWVPG